MTHGGRRTRRITVEIARKIRHARKINRVPARELAREFGLAVKTIYNIAGGHNQVSYEGFRWTGSGHGRVVKEEE